MRRGFNATVGFDSARLLRDVKAHRRRVCPGISDREFARQVGVSSTVVAYHLGVGRIAQGLTGASRRLEAASVAAFLLWLGADWKDYVTEVRG